MQYPAYAQLRPVTDSVGVVIAPNPGYSSLEGTNSWVIRAPGDPRSIVIDPGPEDEGNLNVLNSKASEVALILLTHHHHDHADGATRFHQLTGAPVRELSPAYCIDAPALSDGEIISLEGVTPQIEVVAAPGHTADSVCYFIWSGTPGESTLEGIVTGDTIVGRHTSMISETSGDLGQYMETLELLKKRGGGVALLPGHGPEHEDTAVLAEKYLERRRYRLDQITAVWKEKGRDIELKELVDEMYDDVDPVLRHAAEQSTRVAVRYLNTQGI